MAEREGTRVYAVIPVGERVSALEVRVESLEAKTDMVLEKLSELLEIKHKGMGAIGFVSVLVISASGLAGLITFILNLINHRP